MSDDILQVERRGKIAIVTMNRPAKRNALSEALWKRLKETFESFEPAVRAVVLAGAGDHFCAGLDLTEHKEREAFASIAMSRFAHATLEAIQFGGRPVVAAMQGAVIGGGLEVATSTHIRVSDETTFYQLPEGRRGFYVGGGASVRVAKVIGSGRMVEMMLTGRKLDASAGERLGLSHYVVERGRTLEKAIELAEVVAGNAMIPNYLIIQAIPRIEDMSASDGLWTESIAQAVSMISEDARTGIDAFLERRKADFFCARSRAEGRKSCRRKSVGPASGRLRLAEARRRVYEFAGRSGCRSRGTRRGRAPERRRGARVDAPTPSSGRKFASPHAWARRSHLDDGEPKVAVFQNRDGSSIK